MSNKTKLFKVNYYPMSTKGQISVSKKTYKIMKKECRRGGSHYLCDKLGRTTEVKKINKIYIELETGREVKYFNLSDKEFSQCKSQPNSPVGFMLDKCKENGMSFDDSMKVVDNFLTNIQKGNK